MRRKNRNKKGKEESREGKRIKEEKREGIAKEKQLLKKGTRREMRGKEETQTGRRERRERWKRGE